MAAATLSKDQKVGDLHADFEKFGVRGYWQTPRVLPKPSARLWRWSDIYPLLMRSAEVIDLGDDAARRFIGLNTQIQSMSYGFQVVMPGESAEAHHHTPSALRFAVQGNGAYTTSNGEAMPMEPGDLLTQPNWVWHDHNNKTADPMIWIDSLDAGIVKMLDARFFEKWRDGRVQPITKPDGYSNRRFGALGTITETNLAVPYHYKWPDTEAALQVLAGDLDQRDDVVLEYKHPVTGGHTLRNTTCCIQLLRPGERTRPRRSTGAIIYHVFQGTGSTETGPGGATQTVMTWRDKDVFVVPSWEWRQHENTSSSPAYLFSVSDRPIVEAAGLWREELGGN